MTAVNAHQFGGASDIAVSFSEFVDDKFALVSVGRFFERRKAKTRRGRGSFRVKFG